MSDADQGPREEDLPDTVDLGRAPASLPSRIGHYTIQGLIASGGMGIVYKALQEHPRRAVAIKVMRSGVTTPSELRRFEFEAQLLGRLRHPGIAEIYEAGTHVEGGVTIPFFAMEYIANARNLVEYAGQKSLDLEERLKLFQRICDAVHHGHLKGIVHRDLKPGNLLVGADGAPRVIDFGVARATDSDMAVTHHQTGLGQLIGTLQYMSPEQCAGDPHDIDTRSDVYSLGIVLYELICGRPPYDLQNIPLPEATRLIREQEPPRPGRLDRRLRGDLETIVLKAIEKDRDRRYQSAAALGEDVRRFLAREAINARPASAVYQLRVFARRNKGLLVATAAVAVAVVAGAIVSTAMYFRSREFQAKAALQEARVRESQAYVQDIMGSINSQLGSEIKVSSLLRSFDNRIAQRFADQPEAEVAVRLQLAERYDRLRMLSTGESADRFSELARAHFDRALKLRREMSGETDAQTLEDIQRVASHLSKGYDLPRAEGLYRDLLRFQLAELGDEADASMQTRSDLADLLVRENRLAEADTLTGRVIDYFSRRFGEMDERTRPYLKSRAEVLQMLGRYGEAGRIWSAILEDTRNRAAPGSPDVQMALRDLANLHVAEGRLDLAAAAFDESVDLSPRGLRIRRWLGRDYSPRSQAPTLVLFWESWCPYCQLYLPRMLALRDEKMSSLQIIGLTSLNLGKTEDDARDFMRRNGFDFPNAVYDIGLLDELGFSGLPSVLALRGGRVVWKGHPSDISRGFLEGLVRGHPAANADPQVSDDTASRPPDAAPPTAGAPGA